VKEQYQSTLLRQVYNCHEYCLKALGIDKQESVLYRLQDNMPRLLKAFKRSLSRKTGPDLAKRLLSNRDLFAAELRHDKHATDILLRLIRARDLWTSTVGLGRDNTYDVLHRELHKFGNWRALNDTICFVADVDAPATDEQMAELVLSLSGSGNIVAEKVVPRALQRARTLDFPMTLKALKNLPETGAMNVIPFFQETLADVKQGLRAL
jgi:hypothetical protein